MLIHRVMPARIVPIPKVIIKLSMPTRMQKKAFTSPTLTAMAMAIPIAGPMSMPYFILRTPTILADRVMTAATDRS